MNGRRTGAEDGDTNKGNITFVISGGISGRGFASNDFSGGRNSLGFLSYRTKANVPINRFSQDDIMKKRVLFTHTGNETYQQKFFRGFETQFSTKFDKCYLGPIKM